MGRAEASFGQCSPQIIKAIDGLQQIARPAESKRLELPGVQHELWRLHLGHWRIVYLIVDEQPLVLAIRRRPPYDYSDLGSLIEETE